MRPLRTGLLLLALYLLAVIAAERAYACPGAAGAVPQKRAALLARGVNLTGWLDAPDQTRFDPLLVELRRAGLRHIRLPVDGEKLMPEFTSAPEVRRRLARIDWAVSALLLKGFAVSVDMHPGGRFQNLHRNDPRAGYRALEGAWRVLAGRLKDLPPSHVFFELLNEPSAPVPVWHNQAARLIEHLRKIVPEHTLIYGPGSYQRIDTLVRLAPMADRNIVYAVHFYDPLVFTHQGQDWNAGDPLADLAGVPFPLVRGAKSVGWLQKSLAARGSTKALKELRGALETGWTRKRIYAEFAQAARWSRQHDAPVIVNEFGVLSWKAAPADRARWLAAVSGAARKNCLGWTHWELAEGFGFAITGKAGRLTLDPAILQALTAGR